MNKDCGHNHTPERFPQFPAGWEQFPDLVGPSQRGAVTPSPLTMLAITVVVASTYSGFHFRRAPVAAKVLLSWRQEQFKPVHPP
jgi:hypothetical protein